MAVDTIFSRLRGAIGNAILWGVGGSLPGWRSLPPPCHWHRFGSLDRGAVKRS